MSQKDVSVSVASNVYDASQGVVSFAQALKQALEDGWLPSQDLPAILSEALRDFVPAFLKLDEAMKEFAEDPKSAISALAVAALQLYSVVSK